MNEVEEIADDRSIADSNAGIRVRRSSYPDVDARICDPETGPRTHRSLLEGGLDQRLLDALEQLPGNRIAEMRTSLWEIEADAAGGAFATIAAEACVNPDARDRLSELARSLGTGQTPINIRSDRSDLEDGPVRVFEAVDLTPKVAIELTGAWFEDRRREHREDVLDFLVSLARGCDVVLEVGAIAARRLHQQHRADLPASVTARLNPHSVIEHRVDAGEVPERVEETVADALDDIDPEGTAAAALVALEETGGQSMSYDDLTRELRLSDGHARVLAGRLEEQGLAERLSRPDGRTVLSLLPAGQHYVDSIRTSHGTQSRLSSDWSASDAGGDSERNDPPKNLPPCRVNPRKDGRGEAEATAGDRTDRYRHGAVSIEYMEHSRHSAAVAAANEGEISLVDASLDLQDDGRTPSWSWDPHDEVLVVGAECHNPMQWMTCIARVLSSPLSFNRVLTEDRLDDVLDTPLRILQHGRNLGWLREEDATGACYAERLQEAHEELLELTTELHQGAYDDRDAHRAEILRHAHGIHGVISHLCDLAGITLVREARLPEFSRHWSRRSRRVDLSRTLAIAASIGSSYGHFVPFRQLFEDRETLRDIAISPDVDADAPYGELIGSIVVAGDGVDDLEEVLRSTLQEPKQLHPDAPELAVRVPVRSSTSPAATYRAARSMGRHKSLEVSREAVRWLHSLVRSPYAAAAAFDALEAESIRRDLYLDEVRLAIASLEEDQLLPEASPSARSGVLALARAESEISQAELARRADISTQSWRNHREALEEAGLVRSTPGGWRLSLPFQSERFEDIQQPWPLTDDTSRLLPVGTRHQRDVLMELVDGLGEWNDLVDEALCWPPDPAAIAAALHSLDLESLSRMIEASVEIWDLSPREARIGPRIEQQSIVDLDPPKSGHEGYRAAIDE